MGYALQGGISKKVMILQSFAVQGSSLEQLNFQFLWFLVWLVVLLSLNWILSHAIALANLTDTL